MFGASADPKANGMLVTVSNNGTLGPDHYARRISDKLLSISEQCPDVLRMQAEAYKEQILAVSRVFVSQAVNEERNYAAHLAEQHGHSDLADRIRNR